MSFDYTIVFGPGVLNGKAWGEALDGAELPAPGSALLIDLEGVDAVVESGLPAIFDLCSRYEVSVRMTKDGKPREHLIRRGMILNRPDENILPCLLKRKPTC